MKTEFYLGILLLLFSSCNSEETNTTNINGYENKVHSEVTIIHTILVKDTFNTPIEDSSFVTMQIYTEGFEYNMKYATEDNFLNKKVYTCEECLLRKEVADALVITNKVFMERGYRIKFFDCYRPLDIQKLMWEIVPDARYVANPNNSGSIHNRGGAVDITLVDMNCNELDMGTDFDHFGNEAHHSYLELTDTILANRRLLKTVMEANGFRSISSEWWHYSYKNARQYNLSNFQTTCK